MSRSWTSKSRYGALRECTFTPPNHVSIVCHDIHFYNFSPINDNKDNKDKMFMVDPDGGPYLQIRGIIDIPESELPRRIQSIESTSYNKHNRKLTIELLIE